MVSVRDDLKEMFAQSTGPVGVDDWMRFCGLSYSPEDQALLAGAWSVACDAYADRRRQAGDSYCEHALSVATILASLRLDVHTIAAGMLHDLPSVAGDDWQRLSGACDEEAATLVQEVERVGRVGALRHQAQTSRDQASHIEALRKMLLAMVRDIRVLFIKLAERLHDLRTLNGLPAAAQQDIVQETSDIYAPLANRLGIWQVKWEMEDLCFRYRQPHTYRRVARLLQEKRQDREHYIQQVIDALNRALQAAGIHAEVQGRPKHIYSIWKKMQRKSVDFHELFDIRAVRVLVDDVAACYAVLGVVHTLWKHIPGEFDDYIATPKENDYRSLHTAVLGPEGRAVEVQIRTRDMHEQAELGVAAHWCYKEGRTSAAEGRFEQRIAWLRRLLDQSREDGGGDDLFERFQAELFEERVYVISPRGDVIDLPRGATALDFAYHIHSDIGHRCRGCKVNGRIVPLNRELATGDQVEVLTAREPAPSRDWLRPGRGYLRTARARAKLRAWFRQQDHHKNVAAGRQQLDRELRRLGLQDVQLERLAQKSGHGGLEEFCAALGRGDVSASQLAGLFSEQILPAQADALPRPRRSSNQEGAQDDVTIYGVGNLLTRTAGCCKPTPGDPIIGFVTRGHGVTIHRRHCPTVRELVDADSDRLIDVGWRRRTDRKYPVDVHLEAYDRQGLLRDITAALTNERINVIGVQTSTGADDHRARMVLTIEIVDVDQLSRVMDRLSALRNVFEVHRGVAR